MDLELSRKYKIRKKLISLWTINRKLCILITMHKQPSELVTNITIMLSAQLMRCSYMNNLDRFERDTANNHKPKRQDCFFFFSDKVTAVDFFGILSDDNSTLIIPSSNLHFHNITTSIKTLWEKNWLGQKICLSQFLQYLL